MKLYVVKKYVYARSINDAIKREKVSEIHKVYTEEKPTRELAPAVGFITSKDHDY